MPEFTTLTSTQGDKSKKSLDDETLFGRLPFYIMIARRLGGFPVAFIAVLCMLLNVALTAEGTTLTYSIKAGEESCFYVWVEEVGKKVSFYFAVSPPKTPMDVSFCCI